MIQKFAIGKMLYLCPFDPHPTNSSVQILLQLLQEYVSLLKRFYKEVFTLT